MPTPYLPEQLRYDKKFLGIKVKLLTISRKSSKEITPIFIPEAESGAQSLFEVGEDTPNEFSWS